MKKSIDTCTRTFANGVVITNTTPHPLTFQDLDGSLVSIPSDKELLVNAKAVEQQVSDLFVKTVFEPTQEGQAVIDAIKAVYPDGVIIGSMIAVSAYPGQVAGMVPVPGFERVPPAEKRMRCDRFTIA